MGLVAGVIFAVGLLLVSRLLYKPPKNQSPGLGQDQPTTLSTRGSFVPLLFGTRRIGYVFGWAGDRQVDVISSGGGKDLGGGGGGSQETTYFESAWHLLCVGPATGLTAIYADNKLLWSGNISPSTTASGTATTLAGGQGTFVIYWGEVDQPVNNYLGTSDRVGVRSRWPGICYVVWIRKKLSSSPIWPQMEYVLQAGGGAACLGSAASWLDDAVDTGVNPAGVLKQLLSAPFPFGVKCDPADLDLEGFVELAELAETEHLPVNMLIEQGPEVARPIQALLQDMGVMLSMAEGRMTLIVVRKPSGAVPQFDDSVISPPDASREIDHGDEKVNRVIFTFKNKDNDAYREYDIKIDNDADADAAVTSPQSVPIETVTDLNTANKIARRRSQELAVKSTVTVNALRGARQLIAGQVFNHPDHGNMRISSTKWDDESAKVVIECSPDIYGVTDVSHTQAPGPGAGEALEVDADVDVALFQLDPNIYKREAVAVLRIRKHNQIEGAGVYVSGNGSSYALAGQQPTPCAGGLLLEDLDIGDDDIVATGPKFESDNADAANILDLSSDLESWEYGRQVAVINGEIFFVESVTVTAETAWADATAYAEDDYVVPSLSTGLRYICTTAGTSGDDEPQWPAVVGETVTDGTCVWEARGFEYQLNNMIRARLDTVKEGHVIGDRVFIADTQTLRPITHAVIAVGITLCVKTAPFTARETVDISTVTAVCKGIIGLPEVDYRKTQNDTMRKTRTGTIRGTRLE